MPEIPVFRRHTIYEGTPAERMSCIVGDLDNDGVPEFIIPTRNPDELVWFGRTDQGEWKPHLMDDTFPSISVGAAMVDLTGNGNLDLISGTSDRGNFIYWWECPDDPTQRWTRRVVLSFPTTGFTTLSWRTSTGMAGRNYTYGTRTPKRSSRSRYPTIRTYPLAGR